MRDRLANLANSRRHSDHFTFCLGVFTGILVWTQCFGGPSAAYAQRFAVDDKFEVLFLGEWLPGTVVETDRRGRVLVEMALKAGTHVRLDVRAGNDTARVQQVLSLRIEVNQALAWQAGTSTGPPPVIMLEEGQTAQSEVDRWQHPNVEFFDQVAIPARILDPSYRNGVGTSDVSVQGLVPR